MSLDTNNDLDVAKHLISEKPLFYYKQSFYEYNVNHWIPISIRAVKRLILEVLGDKYKQTRVNNILDIMQLKTGKDVTDINLHQKEKAINTKGGIYNWETKVLTPHNEKTMLLYATNIFNINFKKDAKYNRWSQFVYEIFEKDEDKYDKVALLQEFLGYCLTQDVSFQIALLLLGNGSNGKSIIIQIMELILGRENYSNIELNQFSNKNYIVELLNKYVNFCSEIDHKTQFSSGTFKKIITGDTLTGDRKFKDPIQFQAYCKLLFATNDLPITNDTTKGYFRRLLILKFNRSFEGKEKDQNLLNELKGELDGIFNWLLEGLERLYQNKKFTVPGSSIKEKEKYLETSNSVVSFIREKCELVNEQHEIYDDLFQEYRVFCANSGDRPFKKMNFKNEIEKQFQGKITFSRTGEKGNHFSGIKLKKEYGI